MSPKGIHKVVHDYHLGLYKRYVLKCGGIYYHKLKFDHNYHDSCIYGCRYKRRFLCCCICPSKHIYVLATTQFLNVINVTPIFLFSFMYRYALLAPSAVPQGFMDSRKAADLLLKALPLEESEFRMGHTKVRFITPETWVTYPSGRCPLIPWISGLCENWQPVNMTHHGKSISQLVTVHNI